MQKIIIHALGATMGGAMRHLTNFLPELGKHDARREYVVLIRTSFPDIQVTENIRFERIPDEQASAWVKRTINDVILLPKRVKQEKFDVIVSLTNLGPIWSPVPHIFFQRNSLYFCSHYLSKLTGKLKMETSLRRQFAIASMKRASVIVTPSHAMADMIQESCPSLTGRPFQTLYHGFTKGTLLQEPLEEKYIRHFAVTGVKLLYPTHPALHKGFEVLFEMLACLKSEGLNFTLFTTIAREDWPEGISQYEKRIHELGLEDQIVFLGRVPQLQMGTLYKQCDLMVYPSLCESFGFSMIEAMGHGLPIVAAGTAINTEICGKGAFYYPPTDFKAGVEAIKRALKPELSMPLVAAQQQRLASYDWGWPRYAREFVELIDGIG